MSNSRLKKHLQVAQLSEKYITRKIKSFLLEDIPQKDITTTLFKNRNEIKQYAIYAKEEMVVCGTIIIKHCFSKKCEIQLNYSDGEQIEKGSVIGTIQGPFKEILYGERVMLNLLQKMGGIATLTNRLVKKKTNKTVQLLDTRKTTPGLRLFEKYAVFIGGGQNHRIDLSSAILIKENHIHSIESLQEAVALARNKYPKKIIEIEVDSLKLAEKAAKLNIDSILIDNMSPKKAQTVIHRIQQINNNLYIEVSGGINEQNYQNYMNTGADAISMGCLTHSAKNVDISLILKRG